MPRKTVFIPNYFDDQRFGTHNLEIGTSILKKEFGEASRLIDYKRSKDHLAKHPTDHIGAIRKVPIKTLKMYINAVQSQMFNLELSGRILEKYPKARKVLYKHGSFAFPEKRLPIPKLPLVSFDSEGMDEQLSAMGITKKDFIIRSIPELTPHGGLRDAFADVINLEIGKLADDELNDKMKKVTVSFELQKGSYATIVIKSMFS
jgi:tRNA pseudouridine13 synthase